LETSGSTLALTGWHFKYLWHYLYNIIAFLAVSAFVAVVLAATVSFLLLLIKTEIMNTCNEGR